MYSDSYYSTTYILFSFYPRVTHSTPSLMSQHRGEPYTTAAIRPNLSDNEQIAVSQWLRPSDPAALVVLSTNTSDSIRAAQEWWTVTGTASVILLGVVCALAWWHQRRLRKLFREEAESLETDWVPTTALVVASVGGVPGITAVSDAVVAEQPNCSPPDLTSPTKELG